MDNHVLVSVWRTKGNLRIYDRTKVNDVVILDNNGKNLGIPYSNYFDSKTNRLIQTYFGFLSNGGQDNLGGLVEMSIEY